MIEGSFLECTTMDSLPLHAFLILIYLKNSSSPLNSSQKNPKSPKPTNSRKIPMQEREIKKQ